MKMRTNAPLAGLLIAVAVLEGCAGKNDGQVAVTGAKSAVSQIVAFVRTKTPPPTRPASIVGVYGSLFLAQTLFLPVSAARDGVAALMEMRAVEQAVDDRFALLQSLGNILHIDVTDLLNRSIDRNQTLGSYFTELKTVSEASAREHEEILSEIERVKEDKKSQRKATREVDRAIKEAIKSRDYATAGARQSELSEEEQRLASIEAEEDHLDRIGDAFETLGNIARKRIAAIEANRDILVAGFRVIDVPGIEDIGIIERAQRRRSRGRSSTDGGIINLDADSGIGG